jgi:hypothetical protein
MEVLHGEELVPAFSTGVERHHAEHGDNRRLISERLLADLVYPWRSI